MFPCVASRSSTPVKLQHEPRVDILQHGYECAPLKYRMFARQATHRGTVLTTKHLDSPARRPSPCAPRFGLCCTPPPHRAPRACSQLQVMYDLENSKTRVDSANMSASRDLGVFREVIGGLVDEIQTLLRYIIEFSRSSIVQPMSFVQEYDDFIIPHTVVSLTISIPSIKWV